MSDQSPVEPAEEVQPFMASEDPAEAAMQINKKKRLCRHPGCTKVIKSQGHCQRHGAKAKRCKVDGCDKQAQGTHAGMCKRHWKALNSPDGNNTQGEASKKLLPPAPEGDSIYDSVLPQSISFRPVSLSKANLPDVQPGEDPPAPPSGVVIMPLVEFLREGAAKNEPGWHRNTERRARGLFPVTSLQMQLEPWERQLALVEILLLSGGTPYANFRDLAHAWGRDKGFHNQIVSNVCERRGEVERKRRGEGSSNGAASKRGRPAVVDQGGMPPEPGNTTMGPPPNVNNENTVGI